MTKKEVIDRKWKDLAREHGVSEALLYNRIRNRWRPEIAAITPKGEAPADRFRPKPAPTRSQFPETVHHWSPEQVESHLAEIGPDKNFDAYNRRGAKYEIAAPQLKRESGRRYHKKGGEW